MYIGVIMARLRSVDISYFFRESLYCSWRGWARPLLHCLRSNSSGPPEEFCKIVFIAYMISSLVILMSDYIFLWASKEVLWILNSHRWVWSAEDAIVLFIQYFAHFWLLGLLYLFYVKLISQSETILLMMN